MTDKQKIVIILDENDHIENIITDRTGNLQIIVAQTNPKDVEESSLTYIDDDPWYIYAPPGEVNPGLTKAIFNEYMFDPDYKYLT